MKATILDTDTLSFFFRGNVGVLNALNEYLQHFDRINISVITYYEILNGLYFKDAKRQMAVFEKFAARNNILPLTDDIAKESAKIYAELKSKGQTIGHNDTLIAGTALIHDLRLVTNNVNHFNRIPLLEIENWITQ